MTARATIHGEPHPRLGPSMIAEVRLASMTMTSTWPTGSDARGRGARDSGTKRAVSAIAARPIGMFTRNTARQLSSTSTPPRTGPSAMLMPTTAPQIPIACARSRGSSNVLRMIDIATGLSIAPAAPCSTRKAMSQPTPGARAQASDAAVNSARPNWNTRARPRRSAVDPPSMSRLASTTV